MSEKQAIKKVAALFGVSPYDLKMFIESYRKYKEVRFGPIELPGGSLDSFKEYIREQRVLSYAIDLEAAKQYEQMLELIDIYETEELEE